MKHLGLIRVAAAMPRVHVADPAANAREILQMCKELADRRPSVVVFPELAVTGYTCADLFDNVFVSHEMHLAKPDPEIYHSAVRQIGRPAAQCLFIDDTLINVEAAKHEGLQGAWLDLSKESVCELIRRVV